MDERDCDCDNRSWHDDELAASSLPDRRLARRMAVILERLGASPGAPIPAACQDWVATKAAYRFFDNPRVTESGVLAGHFGATAARFKVSDGVILLL